MIVVVLLIFLTLINLFVFPSSRKITSAYAVTLTFSRVAAFLLGLGPISSFFFLWKSFHPCFFCTHNFIISWLFDFITYFLVRCFWSNGYRLSKWIQWTEFKSWTKLFIFHIVLIPLEKVWIQLISLQLWVTSWADWARQPLNGNWSERRKTLNSNLLNFAYNCADGQGK